MTCFALPRRAPGKAPSPPPIQRAAPPVSRVVKLVDKDSDGVMNKRTVCRKTPWTHEELKTLG